MVVLYVILLPYTIFTYNALVSRFSAAFAHAVPKILIVLLAAAYAIYGFRTAWRAKVLGVLAVCTGLIFLVFATQANPNKLIHIPEYICLTWLVFHAVSADYFGKGALFLVWICTTMLGVVDELQQGVLPGRFYGGQDMMINAVSSFIGILALAGLNRKLPGSLGLDR